LIRVSIHPLDSVGFDVRILRNTAVPEAWFMAKPVCVSNVRKREREERLVK